MEMDVVAVRFESSDGECVVVRVVSVLPFFESRLEKERERLSGFAQEPSRNPPPPPRSLLFPRVQDVVVVVVISVVVVVPPPPPQAFSRTIGSPTGTWSPTL